MANPNEPGFVFNPSSQPAYPSYPSHAGAQVYPPPTAAQHPPAYQHQPFPAPIQNQPGYHASHNSNWFAGANFQDYLRNASSFHVKQKVELLEALVGFESENKYTVKDQSGNKIFYVVEESNVCGRLCLGKSRPFVLRVKDTRGVDILVFERNLDCTLCCGLCCPDSLKITDATGNLIGTVDEQCSFFYPMFELKDASGNLQLKADGPACPMACGGAVTFRLRTPADASIGHISKEWSGFIQEFFTDADYFSMSFPQNLDINMKAVCLGLLFLIDFHYFEGSNNKRQGGRRLFG